MFYILDNPHLIVEIFKTQDGFLVDEKALHEGMQYKGSENDIFMTVRYETEFFCIYELNNYPFDSQSCSIDILSAHNIKNDVELIPGSFLDVSIQGSTPQFTRNLQEIQSLRNGTLLKGTMQFQRMANFHIFCTYLPTFCILVISVITLFLDESHFEATVMLSLTAMLVLYTLFQSITTEIPSTAYLKLLDIWLIICLVLPFIIFMIEVVLEIWKRRLENQNTFILIKVGDTIKKIPEPGRHSTRLGFKMAMQVIFPIICVVFLVIYAFMIINSLN